MSYNIDTWKTKTIKSFKIPLNKFYEVPDITVALLPDSEVNIEGNSEGFVIKGKLIDNMILVSEIELCGEGSGYYWDDFLSLLKESTGELVATQIWEGGDSITRLSVKDGKVNEESVEV